MTYSNVIKLLITISAFILFSASVLAAPPTHSTPILNSTLGDNDLDENLTVYNKSTSDPDGDPVKNIHNWFRNNTPIAILNLPFEGGSNATNTTDYSGRNRVVTINGTTITWNASAGYDGKGAYDFNESNFSEKMRVTGLPTTMANGFSIAAWIKPRELDSKFQMIFGDCDNIHFYFLKTNTNIFRLSYGNSTGQQKLLDSPTIPSANIWYHVVITLHPNSTANLYVNGTINASQSLGQGIATTVAATMNIGNSETQCGQPLGVKFNGTIDEFAFYNMSLTPDQVRALYNNRSNTIDSSMLQVGDTWNASITPNDGTADGITLFSNAVLIVQQYILNRHAPENITGDWSFRGMINATGIWTFARNLTLGAGLLVQNENDSLFRVLRAPIKFKDLLDRTANENVTGNWTFNGNLTVQGNVTATAFVGDGGRLTGVEKPNNKTDIWLANASGSTQNDTALVVVVNATIPAGNLKSADGLEGFAIVRDTGAGPTPANVVMTLRDGTNTITIESTGSYTNNRGTWFKGRWDPSSSTNFLYVKIGHAGASSSNQGTLNPDANISFVIEAQSFFDSGAGTLFASGVLWRGGRQS